mmetsp:Transcript_15781/g.48850  ORF Transcript_15781/g.48850 Transcript_15781/m.48850 type:complete len:1528 (+) Transcript_15781:623-5206(+)
MSAEEKEVLKLKRLAVANKAQAEAMGRDWQRQQDVKRAFESVDDGDGTLGKAEFKEVLELLGLHARPPNVDEGVPSSKLFDTRFEAWWLEADAYKAGVVDMTQALGVLPDKVCAALEADEKTRRKKVAYRELLLMEAEDFDAEEPDEADLDPIQRALREPLRGYQPFKLETRAPDPAPAAWRDDGGATGKQCAAPPLPEDGAVREGWRSLETHQLIAVERGLEALPLILGSTLLQQLGVVRISLPRNKIETLHCFSEAPAVGCRGLSMLRELRLPRNNLKCLPEDVGLFRQVEQMDLSGNALTALPRSFLELEALFSLDLTHNNFKTLPDDLGELTRLETLALAENILQKLPSTLPRLHELTALDVSGNGLTHLCVFPNLPEVARIRTPGEADWDCRMEPKSRRYYYCNTRTGRVQKVLPAALRLAKEEKGGKLKLGKNRRGPAPGAKVPGVDSKLKMNTISYNHRKVELARLGVDEWDVAWSDGDGATVYTSRVNGDREFKIPSSLDKLGSLRSLTELKIDRNQLRDLPPSLAQLKELKLFRCRDNYIRSLADNMGELQKLTNLDCATNELSELPPSFARLTKLTFLSLQSNRFEKLPPLIGKLTGLKRLMLGNNALVTLPYEVGFLTTLEELQVFNNPLEDPPYETISDLPAMMWSCRQKYWALINGPVPVVVARKVGIADEIHEPEPAYQERIGRVVEEAAATGRMELQLQGVTEIPGAVRVSRNPDVWDHLHLAGLKVLKLSMNHFAAPPLFSPSLGNLRVLWLTQCEIRAIHDDVDHLQKLRELILEDNFLTKLPRTFPRLRRLELLNVAKNRLYELPENLGNLTSLTKLDLAMNNLEHLPLSITQLRMLEDLSVASNHLYKLPELTSLENLTSLNLDANGVHILPPRLGQLPLRSLRASHNRLERLGADTLLGRAEATLEHLGVASNNLLELPSCIPACTALRCVQVEYNPMRNPPAELLSEGVEILLQYCRIRDARLEKFKQLLTEFQFDYDELHMAPEAFGVITGRSGFLTPDDLTAFDKECDAYLNGPYYACPKTDVDILERVDNLRHEREHTFYHTILLSLIDLMREEISSHGDPGKRRFGHGVLLEETRPWGREGEEVGSYALSLDALVKLGRPNRYRKKERPALFDVLKERLPPSLFDYTLEVLKDAIVKYQGPYGHVAQLDKVEFERCECVDEKGRGMGHEPCVLPAICIEKIIYSQGEAQRRVQEDDKIRSAWAKLWQDLETKIKQRHGKLILNNEVHRRKRTVQTRIKGCKEALDAAKSKVKEENEKFEIAKRRKINFENGDAFNFHRLSSAEEAQQLEVDAAEKVDAAQQSVKSSEGGLAMAKQQLKMPPKVLLQIAIEDVKRKYCVVKWQEIIDENRREAIDSGWRRPWDGKDGKLFEDYSRRWAPGLNAGQDCDTLPVWIKKLRPDATQIFTPDPNLPPGAVQAKTAAQIAYELFPFDWRETDDMTLYENQYYDAFEADYITEDMAAQNRKVARNLRHLERTGKTLDKNFAPEDVKQALGTTDGGEIRA